MSDLVKPFRALRPQAEHAGDVIAPPYDVVSLDEAAALAAGRPFSFLHISRPEIDLPPGTAPHSAAVYERGAANLARLQQQGILLRDPTPSFYLYRMTAGAHSQTGVAFTASIEAYEQHRIRKHELTRPEKENDRVQHIETLGAQTGPVLCAYRASPSLAASIDECAADAPLFEVVGPNDVLHALWRIDESERVTALSNALNTLDALYIADGHHRSAAAARVARQRGARAAGTAGRTASHDYFLIVAFPHDALLILDYNRVVRDLNGMSAEVLLGRIASELRVEPSSMRAEPEHSGTFGMYLAGSWYRVTVPERLLASGDAVASLDVSLLQNRLLGPLLGIGDPRSDPRIDFVGGARGLGELERRVDSGRAAVAFALYPTRMEQLMAVADADCLMPPKSTWFEPKLADGLLSHVLD
jgi:uncharacterized protein (DUF1015 family)